MKWGSRLILLAGLCAALTAPAQDFHRTRVPGQETCLAWGNRDFRYTYHAAGSSQTVAGGEFVAMEEAFNAWRTLAQGCTDFTFTESAVRPVEVTVGYKQGSADNDNVLTFRELSCADEVAETDPCWDDDTCANRFRCWSHADGTIALTTTTFSFRTATIYDADIEFNAAPQSDGERFLFTTISSPECEPENQSQLCVATDIQNTLTHELGHVVGLDHVDEEESTMAATASIGETSKRAIDPGTALGFCGTYPRGAPSTSCDLTGTVERRVVAVNNGTAGLSSLGCATVGGPLWAWIAVALPIFAGRWRRRR